MCQYYNNTKNHILTQTSSDTLGDAISETMKKLSIKAKKQLKKKMERRKAASYSVDIEISTYQARERDEDEYSIIGLDEIHENEDNNTRDFDSFNILRMRSRSLVSQKKDSDKESCAEEADEVIEDTEETFPLESSEEELAPAISTLNAALQAFSLSTAND